MIERYANSSDPMIGDFDWKRAQFCLASALDMDASDHAVRGKLALSNGYLSLMQDPPAEKAAKASFERERLRYVAAEFARAAAFGTGSTLRL